MPEIYADDNGARVIVRHKGPPGKGFPSGGTTGQILAKTTGTDYDAQWVNPPNGTGAAVGPASSMDGHVVLFDGTTGKLLKSAGQSLSNFASLSLVATKQDKETGKGLSQENFTTTLKNKLDGITYHYRGTYATTALVESEVADPVAGDYAFVEVYGEPQHVSFWDETNSQWDHKIVQSMTGEEIANALFVTEDAAAYDQETCRIFTDAEKTQLAQHEALIQDLNLDDLSRPFGSLSYFNLTGTLIAIDAVSDGLSNMVKIGTTTALGGVISGFDNGGASNGRLRYTGNATRSIKVTAKISFSSLDSEKLVLGIAKNGAVDLASRIVHDSRNSSGIVCSTLSAIISLSLNDYLEVFVGNTTSTSDLTVHVLSIEATTV